MEKVYFLNNNDDNITFEVQVSTRGIVSTEVSRKLNNSVFVTIAKSVEPPNANGKGMITERSFGESDMLLDSALDVFTLVRLDLIPENEWPAMFELLMVTCILRGGSDGTQKFDLDPDDKEKSTSGKTISAKIRINLKQK